METFCHIRDKDGKLVPQKLYPHHKKYFEHAKSISYVVKGRQIWFTTTIIGDFMYDCNIKDGHKAIFVNLDAQKTEAVFDRAHCIHDEWPTKLKQKLDSDTKGDLTFSDTKSQFLALTCKNDMGEKKAKEFGRSLTAKAIHISEAAYVVHLKHLLAGILGSRPKTGEEQSRLILESTGNGTQGDFYERCMAVKDHGAQVVPNVWHFGDQSLHFIPWFEHFEYRMDIDPFESVHVPEDAKRKWLENEIAHREQMDKYDDMDEADKDRALNFLRYIALNEYELVSDPDNCVRITNQEYPATMLHAFQSTGGAYLSLTRTEQQCEKWKNENQFGEMGQLPIRGRVVIPDEGKAQFIPNHNGDIQLWEPPVAGWHDRYLVFGDCGQGMPEGDNDFIGVLDRVKNKVVAVAHGTFGPQKAAAIFRALGLWYHNAKIAWENNNPGVGVTIKLREWDYPNLYKWRDGESNLDFGWLTNEQTRKNGLEILRNQYHNITSGIEIPFLEFYKEARAFQIPMGKTKPEGLGEHDDIIMGHMVGCAVSSMMPTPERVKRTKQLIPGTVGYQIHQSMMENNTPKGMRNW